MNLNRAKKFNNISLTLSKCFYKLGFNFIGRIISRRRVFSSFKFLEENAKDFLYKDYDFTHLEEIKSSSSPIFVMWLQGGEDVMPETVKKCFQSIKNNSILLIILIEI